MGADRNQGFIHGGRERLLEASSEKIKAIEQRIRGSHAEALAKASAVERLKIEASIQRKLKAEVDRLAPPDGHY